jgi:VWFA-related protein
MKRHCSALLLGILILLSTNANAQTHREVISVEVVDVPVYVFTHGKPIRDLTKDNFELFVNGKRQHIDYFDPIDFAADAAGPPPVRSGDEVKAPAPAPIRDPRERRLFLLLFDLVYNRPAALARAQKAAVAMVDRALPQDLFAVATCSSRGTVVQTDFIIPFTRDRYVIRRAVLKLSPSSAHDALAISITDAERQTTAAWVPVVSGEDPMHDIMAAFGPEETQRSKTAARSQLDDFSMVAGRLAELEGYKNVILFSEGFSPYYISGAPPNLAAGTAIETDNQMAHALQSMVESFRASGVLLHTVDLAVIDPISLNQTAVPVYVNGSPASVQRFDALSNDTLFAFAAQTGGQFIHSTNDIAGALADLSTTNSVGYRLGFKPVDPRKGANTIDVKVKNVPRGTTISFRKGFSSTPEPANTGDALLLADIIQNDIPQSGTPPAFSFGEWPFIDVLVPARQLARELGAVREAKIMLYVFDDMGTAVEYREKKISIPANPAADTAIRQKLVLPAGKYVAKALLRVGTSIGFAKVAFAIPEEK